MFRHKSVNVECRRFDPHYIEAHLERFQELLLPVVLLQLFVREDYRDSPPVTKEARCGAEFHTVRCVPQYKLNLLSALLPLSIDRSNVSHRIG